MRWVRIEAQETVRTHTGWVLGFAVQGTGTDISTHTTRPAPQSAKLLTRIAQLQMRVDQRLQADTAKNLGCFWHLSLMHKALATIKINKTFL